MAHRVRYIPPEEQLLPYSFQCDSIVHSFCSSSSAKDCWWHFTFCKCQEIAQLKEWHSYGVCLCLLHLWKEKENRCFYPQLSEISLHLTKHSWSSHITLASALTSYNQAWRGFKERRNKLDGKNLFPDWDGKTVIYFQEYFLSDMQLILTVIHGTSTASHYFQRIIQTPKPETALFHNMYKKV